MSCSNATKWQHIINPMATPWDKDVRMQQRHEVATYHQPNGNALGQR